MVLAHTRALVDLSLLISLHSPQRSRTPDPDPRAARVHGTSALHALLTALGSDSLSPISAGQTRVQIELLLPKVT